MSDRDGNSFVWFLAGLGLGALVGVLYAPRSAAKPGKCCWPAPRRAGTTCAAGRARRASRRRSGQTAAATW